MCHSFLHRENNCCLTGYVSCIHQDCSLKMRETVSSRPMTQGCAGLWSWLSLGTTPPSWTQRCWEGGMGMLRCQGSGCQQAAGLVPPMATEPSSQNCRLISLPCSQAGACQPYCQPQSLGPLGPGLGSQERRHHHRKMCKGSGTGS